MVSAARGAGPWRGAVAVRSDARTRPRAVADRLYLGVGHVLDADELAAGRLHGADQLVELGLDRRRVAVLRVLHQEHHQEGDDGGTRVDDELPVLGEAEQRSGQRPHDHPAEREHEGERLAREGGDPPGEGGEGAVHQAAKLATVAPTASTSADGPTGKTWCGVPAAAQIVAKSSRRGSSQASIGVRWPSGATPPIAKPVTARTEAASAFSSATPASRAALPGSTRLPPAVRNRR